MSAWRRLRSMAIEKRLSAVRKLRFGVGPDRQPWNGGQHLPLRSLREQYVYARGGGDPFHYAGALLDSITGLYKMGER